MNASRGPRTQQGARPTSGALSNSQFCGQAHTSRVGAGPRQGRASSGQDTWRQRRTLWVAEAEIRVLATAVPLSEACGWTPWGPVGGTG